MKESETKKHLNKLADLPGEFKTALKNIRGEGRSRDWESRESRAAHDRFKQKFEKAAALASASSRRDVGMIGEAINKYTRPDPPLAGDHSGRLFHLQRAQAQITGTAETAVKNFKRIVGNLTQREKNYKWLYEEQLRLFEGEDVMLVNNAIEELRTDEEKQLYNDLNIAEILQEQVQTIIRHVQFDIDGLMEGRDPEMNYSEIFEDMEDKATRQVTGKKDLPPGMEDLEEDYKKVAERLAGAEE